MAAPKERAAALTERMRIARELHDIVAHDVSVMLILAQAARRSMDADPERARAAMASVEDAGREAVAELRRMLHILRPGGEPEMVPAVIPQPSLARLDALLARARDAGLDVELRTEGEAGALAPGVDLTAFHVIEEALGHHDRGRARVTLRWSDAQLDIEVVSSAHARRALTGMRERVTMCDGQLHVGPLGRGSMVRARLPRERAITPPAPAAA